jgi:hypothetical protein
MSDPLVHIAAWEAEGLIDGPLADRLRGSIGIAPGAPAPADPETRIAPADGGRLSPTSLSSFFGPSVTIGEMFGYLGVAFLLGAWTAFLARLVGTNDQFAVLTAGTAAAAGVMAGLGGFLARGDARRRRGAGVSFLAATGLAAGAAAFLIQLLGFAGSASGIFVAGVAVAVAAILRRLLPAVATQLGLLVALTGLVSASLTWLRAAVLGEPGGADFGFASSPEPVGVVLVAGGCWLIAGLGMGILGLYEARRAATDAAATRRAAVTRLWAGLVAVVGLATALTRSGYLGTDRYGRLLEPWIAELAILVLAAILVERAFRRDANAFILSAAIGLIVALTDFNFSYLSKSTDIGLLIEGAILLAVGFASDRLRRRLDRSRGRPPGPVAADGGELGVAPT